MTSSLNDSSDRPSYDGEDIRELDALAEAILTLTEADEVKRFLRDLCTRAELEALAHRWLIARLLSGGLPYLAVAEQADASTATVTRVSQWLHHGTGGYELALERRSKGNKPGKAGN
jgi:TrpR-related protein YerC/YecD